MSGHSAGTFRPLSPGSAALLEVIRRRPGLKMRELLDILPESYRGAMTARAQVLEAQGLIRSEKDGGEAWFYRYYPAG